MIFEHRPSNKCFSGLISESINTLNFSEVSGVWTFHLATFNNATEDNRVAVSYR